MPPRRLAVRVDHARQRRRIAAQPLGARRVPDDVESGPRERERAGAGLQEVARDLRDRRRQREVVIQLQVDGEAVAGVENERTVDRHVRPRVVEGAAPERPGLPGADGGRRARVGEGRRDDRAAFLPERAGKRVRAGERDRAAAARAVVRADASVSRDRAGKRKRRAADCVEGDRAGDAEGKRHRVRPGERGPRRHVRAGERERARAREGVRFGGVDRHAADGEGGVKRDRRAAGLRRRGEGGHGGAAARGRVAAVPVGARLPVAARRVRPRGRGGSRGCRDGELQRLDVAGRLDRVGVARAGGRGERHHLRGGERHGRRELQQLVGARRGDRIGRAARHEIDGQAAGRTPVVQREGADRAVVEREPERRGRAVRHAGERGGDGAAQNARAERADRSGGHFAAEKELRAVRAGDRAGEREIARERHRLAAGDGEAAVLRHAGERLDGAVPRGVAPRVDRQTLLAEGGDDPRVDGSVGLDDAAVRLDARGAGTVAVEVVRLQGAAVEDPHDTGAARTALEEIEVFVALKETVRADIDVNRAACGVVAPGVVAGGAQDAAADVHRDVSFRGMVAETQVTGSQLASIDVQHGFRRHARVADGVPHRDVVHPRVAAVDVDRGGEAGRRGGGVAVGTPDRQEGAEIVIPAVDVQVGGRLRSRSRGAVLAHDELVVAEIIGHRVRRIDHDATVQDDKAGDADRRAVAVGADVRHFVDFAQGAAVEGVPASRDRGGRGDGHRARSLLDQAAVHRREASGEREVVLEVQHAGVLLRARRHQDQHVAVGGRVRPRVAQRAVADHEGVRHAGRRSDGRRRAPVADRVRHERAALDVGAAEVGIERVGERHDAAARRAVVDLHVVQSGQRRGHVRRHAVPGRDHHRLRQEAGHVVRARAAHARAHARRKNRRQNRFFLHGTLLLKLQDTVYYHL